MVATASQNKALADRVNALEKSIKATRKTTTWTEVGILWGVYLVAIAIPPSIATANYLSYQAEQIMASPAARWLGLAGENAGRGDNATNGQTYASPIVGKSLQDMVNYKPTHGQSFGPETGNQRSYGPHGGVDFACRVGGCAGAAVASPIAGKVSEIRRIGTSANGASYQVHIQGQDWQGAIEHQLVHVDSVMVAVGDTVTAGQVVAKVSPTDSVSTGPHLDWKIKRGGAWVDPQDWAKDAIEQNRSRPRRGGDSAEGFPVDAYIQAISSQESGHSYSAVNPHSEAMGRYQFMPATMASVAGACPAVATVPSTSEFLGSPELQDAIMRCKVERDLKTIQAKSDNINTQCRMMAATHYSGNPDRWNHTGRQTYNGASYPSIAAYTTAVCREIN